MTQYIGIDAHSKTCTAVVTDSKGNILKKQVFATSERNLLDFIPWNALESQRTYPGRA
jgi:predicted NBD/HSP70 family sugar kinase